MLVSCEFRPLLDRLALAGAAAVLYMTYSSIMAPARAPHKPSLALPDGAANIDIRRAQFPEASKMMPNKEVREMTDPKLDPRNAMSVTNIVPPKTHKNND